MSTSITTATNPELRTKIKAALEGEGISQVEIARDFSVSTAALSQWLNGKYPGDNTRLEAQARRWLETRAQAAATADVLPSNPGYFATPTSEEILGVFRYSRGRGTIGLIVGGAGVSKSTSARHMAATELHVWHVIASPATAGKGPFLLEICAAMDLAPLSHRPSILEGAIVEKMRATRGLLIVDDAQFLPVDTLYQVAWLSEKSRAGVVIMGNEVTHGRVQAGYAQLSSRIMKTLRLHLPTRGDLDACLAAWEVSEHLPESSLSAHADWFWGADDSLKAGPCRQNGGMRWVCATIALAIFFARGAQQSLGLKHLKAAWKDISGRA